MIGNRQKLQGKFWLDMRKNNLLHNETNTGAGSSEWEVIWKRDSRGVDHGLILGLMSDLFFFLAHIVCNVQKKKNDDDDIH